MNSLGPVRRLGWLSVTVSDLDATERFYENVLGFRTLARGGFADPVAWLDLLDAPCESVERLVMGLGEQSVEFLRFVPPGKPYPSDSNSTDLWFQHMAIVVSDMDRAYAHLCGSGVVPISESGAEQLPPTTGSVRAFKFRDIDGHPLELLSFPPGGQNSPWQGAHPDRLFLGIDHSAIAVSDIARSQAFYTRLGLSCTASSVNRGSAQQRLDAVEHDVVDVIALAPETLTPHVELLGYRVGSRRRLADARGNDLAAMRFVFLGPGIDPAHVAGDVHRQTSSEGGGSAVRMQDPDGHVSILLSA